MSGTLIPDIQLQRLEHLTRRTAVKLAAVEGFLSSVVSIHEMMATEASKVNQNPITWNWPEPFHNSHYPWSFVVAKILDGLWFSTEVIMMHYRDIFRAAEHDLHQVDFDTVSLLRAPFYGNDDEYRQCFALRQRLDSCLTQLEPIRLAFFQRHYFQNTLKERLPCQRFHFVLVRYLESRTGLILRAAPLVIYADQAWPRMLMEDRRPEERRRL